MSEFLMFLFLLFLALGTVIAWLVVKVRGMSGDIARLEANVNALRRERDEFRQPEQQNQAEVPMPPPLPVIVPPPVIPDSVFVKTSERPMAPPVEKTIPAILEVPADVDRPVEAVALAQQPKRTINWEQLMGVKLFAWIGGFALFLGVSFFVKYAFDNNMLPPEFRVAMGFLTGIGLVIGGVMMRRREYVVTAQTLCATGILILYATTFACRSVYHFAFFQDWPAFAVMSLVTAAAFVLAVRMEAQVIGILGMLGGFLTPPLLGSNVDNPMGLFTYIGLLNIGLMAVAIHRRWGYLVVLGAVGTLLTEVGWTIKFFEVSKVMTAMTVFVVFDLLFYLAWELGRAREKLQGWLAGASMAVSFSSLFYAFYLLTFKEISAQPWLMFGFVFIVDAFLLAIAMRATRLTGVHLAAGTVVFLLLSTWTTGYLTLELLNWALGMFLLFAVLHSVFPVVLQKCRPGLAPVWWGNIFPPLALLLVMMPMFRFTELSVMVWPCVLLIDVVAVLLAMLTASVLAVMAVLVLTLGATAVWLLRGPAVVGDLPEMLLVVGGFAVFFFIVGVFSGRKVFGSLGEALGTGKSCVSPESKLGISEAWTQAMVPAFSAILPFVLLIMMTSRLALVNPSPIYGLALLMTVLLLGVAARFRMDFLALVGLLCVLALEHSFHFRHFNMNAATIPLAWSLGFYALFLVFPFVFARRFESQTTVWIASALSGPLHYYLVHRMVDMAWPNGYMGLLPLAFALPSLAAVAWRAKLRDQESAEGIKRLAWLGACALFFITLIFPVQFDRQWITLGWALEGVAVLWLFHRVPHPGLRWAGMGLLVISFARLALNPAVLGYQPRATTAIWNWYLYSYGLATLCLFAGAWLLQPPRDRIGRFSVQALLTTLGVVLGFLLMNIEIADYFTTEGSARLVFEFTGNFGRDMTYSIAWALFALVLMVAGFWKEVKAARYAGLILLGATLLKLFFHDLARLQQLYRIGALVGVAVVAIFASFLYQRFFAQTKHENK